MSRLPQLPDGFQDIDFNDAAHHAKDNRECIRLLGLAFLQQCHTVSEVANLLSVSNDSVHGWLRRFKTGGISAMQDKGGRGRKPVIPEDSHSTFKEAVLQLQEQKRGGRIVGRDVLAMLDHDFQTQCNLRTVYKLMHRVKLSWISGRSKHPKQNLDEQEAFKKNFAQEVKTVLPSSANHKAIDVWFQDEARFGQQNSISRVWAPTGSRPGLIRQQQYEYAYLFGAVCPEQDKAIGLVLPNANSKGLSLHLDEIAQATETGHHAVVILDRAGFHMAESLPRYENLSLLRLPPCAPELNSSEALWEWMREHDLSNMAFDSYEDIVDTCCDAWNKLRNEAGRLRSLCSRRWAVIP